MEDARLDARLDLCAGHVFLVQPLALVGASASSRHTGIALPLLCAASCHEVDQLRCVGPGLRIRLQVEVARMWVGSGWDMDAMWLGCGWEVAGIWLGSGWYMGVLRVGCGWDAGGMRVGRCNWEHASKYSLPTRWG